MFVALLDRRNRIVVIEEPENSLHPWILRHFINACKAATGKQVFLTTHSLVALDESPLEGIFLVTRKAGGTAVEKCDEKHPEAKQAIAEQLMGPGELWDSGALDAVPEQLEMFQE
jgi:predicted ATPase